MQPIRVRSVVLPEPLGPLRTVICLDGAAHILDRGKLVRLPRIETFRDINEFDHGHDLMAASGSTVAVNQDGIMVAAE